MDYQKFFDLEEDAAVHCANKNMCARAAGNMKDVYALVDGPEDNFAVVDLMTAIHLGQGYKILG